MRELFELLVTITLPIPLASSEYLRRSFNYFRKFFLLGIRSVRDGVGNVILFEGTSIFLRRNSSDFLVFDQIFLNRELEEIIRVFKKESELNYMIDCGANIGLTALFVSRNFSECKILAIEPEQGNFEILLKNLRLNENAKIVPINKGVWSKAAVLEHDRNFCPAKGWAFSLREPKDPGVGNIRVDTLDKIVSDAKFDGCDYLKIDIEGAEFEVFRNVESLNEVLNTTKVISVEVHEKRGSKSEIEAGLIKLGFELGYTGELIVGYGIKYRNRI